MTWEPKEGEPVLFTMPYGGQKAGTYRGRMHAYPRHHMVEHLDGTSYQPKHVEPYTPWRRVKSNLFVLKAIASVLGAFAAISAPMLLVYATGQWPWLLLYGLALVAYPPIADYREARRLRAEQDPETF